MSQTNINIRMDENLKKDFDALCNEMGLTMTAAFTVFAKTVTRRRAIPFEISMESNFTRKASATDTVENIAGILHRYANPALIPFEGEAWEKSVKEKHVVG
ncbi:MAG: type II toxin-antitoxin system RelB/DinJ family antitoxin [Synergistaceae bacterium]|nr:type II toxin-antitoxin system RelB/DinJ family antitoxin [Synergistaceae bacterium]